MRTFADGESHQCEMEVTSRSQETYRVLIQTAPIRDLSGQIDMGRVEEAQQVWRSLVCRNHFEYPVAPDPHDPSRDSIVRLPQDHDGDWWLG